MPAEIVQTSGASEAETSTPPALLGAIEEIWRLQYPGPKKLFASQPFVHLRQTCEALYPFAGSGHALSFALHHACPATIRNAGDDN